jgi:hypothetical protein
MTMFPIVIVQKSETELPIRQWALDKETLILGREENCDIYIPIRQISRQHICFRIDADGHYIIEDLSSKNGTWVNKNKLEGSQILRNGDEIDVARQVHLKFTFPVNVTETLTSNVPIVTEGRLKLDIEGRRVFIREVELDPPLSLPQFRLLEMLFLHSTKVCTREEVVHAVWPEAIGEGVSEQAIDALVRRLRDRLAEVDPEQQYIITVRGHGFRLDNPEE